MKIIILGAGSVGSSLAANLTREKKDIVIVDKNPVALRELQDRLDIATVQGHASHPNILKKAGAADADMIIAVTDSDEINMLACQVAYSLFHIPVKICRVREKSYLNQQKLFGKEAIPADFLISPEQLVTQYIERLLEHPGALQVVDFANDKARLVAVKAFFGGPIVGQALNQIPNHMPNIDTRVAAIFRKDGSIIPEGDTIVEVDDEVFFIAATEHISAMMKELRGHDTPYRRVIIAGGGNIGSSLAKAIELKHQVKIIDRNRSRCEILSDMLNRSIVLHGNASDKDLLLSENIDKCDVFCALTNDDEANIMSSLLAKRLGAKKVITLITNIAYVDLVQGGEIDIALSPQQISIGSLLRHVRRGDLSNVYSLRRGAAEAIEIIAHGDANTSDVVGKCLADIPLPEGATIGAIVRGEEVVIAHKHIEVQEDDHVIIFLTDKSSISKIEKLFQVGVNFI